MGKRRTRDGFWTKDHGGMPTWAIAASVAVILAIVGVVTVAPSLRGEAAPYVRPSDAYATPTPTVTVAPVVMSVLSDSHANNEGSWWRQTVEAGTVPGVTMGAFQSQPGADAATLAGLLDPATAQGGLVLVQAGTNDLLSAVAPDEALTRVVALWDGVVERGATPVAVLVPPSNDRPAEAVELNRLITETATARGMAVIDVYTVVANDDGTWVVGMDRDGVHASDAGAALMADTARGQLEALTAG